MTALDQPPGTPVKRYSGQRSPRFLPGRCHRRRPRQAPSGAPWFRERSWEIKARGFLRGYRSRIASCRAEPGLSWRLCDGMSSLPSLAHRYERLEIRPASLQHEHLSPFFPEVWQLICRDQPLPLPWSGPRSTCHCRAGSWGSTLTLRTSTSCGAGTEAPCSRTPISTKRQCSHPPGPPRPRTGSASSL